jgi:hypothetical protein
MQTYGFLSTGSRKLVEGTSGIDAAKATPVTRNIVAGPGLRP